jgi:5,10-methylenetetrahydromethanopterin reductase
MVGIYASSMPAEEFARNGVDAAELKPIIDAIVAATWPKGVEVTSPELAERLSVSGSPAECAAKLRDKVARPVSTT